MANEHNLKKSFILVYASISLLLSPTQLLQNIFKVNYAAVYNMAEHFHLTRISIIFCMDYKLKLITDSNHDTPRLHVHNLISPEKKKNYENITYPHCQKLFFSFVTIFCFDTLFDNYSYALIYCDNILGHNL